MIAAPLNSAIEFATKANSTLTPLSPTHGVLSVGESGVEFNAANGPGFMQFPWANITTVEAQLMFGGRWVRGIYLITDAGDRYEFILHKGKDTLRALRKHLKHEQFVARTGNIPGIFRRKKNDNQP